MYKARPAFLHQYAAHFTIYNHALVAHSVRVGQGNQCSRSALGVLSDTILPSQAKPSQAKPSQAKPSQAKPSQAKPIAQKNAPAPLVMNVRKQIFGKRNSAVNIR